MKIAIVERSLGEEIRRRFGKDKVRFVIAHLGEPSVRSIKETLALHDPSFKTVNRALDDLIIDYTIQRYKVGDEWHYRLVQA